MSIRKNSWNLYTLMGRNMPNRFYSANTDGKKRLKNSLEINNFPQLRFFQFTRQNSPHSRLGIISEDGKKFIDLSGHSTFPQKLSTLLRSNCNVHEMDDNVCKSKVECVNSGVTFLPPITESEKILCVDIPQKTCIRKLCPIVSNKLPSSLIGPNENIILPPCVTEVSCRTELAVIIGRIATRVDLATAMDYVFGYSIAQNIRVTKFSNENLSCRNQPLIGGSINTFCPLGPIVVHQSLIPNPLELMTMCRINGYELQCDSTNGLRYKIDEIIHFITQFITLAPGDVILTGPPSGIGVQHRCVKAALKEGDIIESEIEHIGKLRNTVVKCAD